MRAPTIAPSSRMEVSKPFVGALPSRSSYTHGNVSKTILLSDPLPRNAHRRLIPIVELRHYLDLREDSLILFGSEESGNFLVIEVHSHNHTTPLPDSQNMSRSTLFHSWRCFSSQSSIHPRPKPFDSQAHSFRTTEQVLRGPSQTSNQTWVNV